MSAYTRMQARIAELEAALTQMRGALAEAFDSGAATEREACARIAAEFSFPLRWELTPGAIAKAIRARGSK